MKKFAVTMRQTITKVQIVQIEAGSVENAAKIAENHLKDDLWEYDTDCIDFIEAEELED